MHTSFENGYWFEPTIISGLSVTSRCMQEEIFGPVVTITPFDTEDEVCVFCVYSVLCVVCECANEKGCGVCEWSSVWLVCIDLDNKRWVTILYSQSRYGL
jgi:hypothetical protein